MTDENQASDEVSGLAVGGVVTDEIGQVKLLGVDKVEVEENEEDNGNEAIAVESEVSVDSDETVAAEAPAQEA